MLRPGGLWFLLAAALALGGCTPIYWDRVTLNQKLSAHDIAFIVPGRTPFAEVIARLGAPGELAPADAGFVASYFYYDAADFYVDLGYPIGFISPVASEVPHRLALGTTGIGTDRLEIGVGADGRVTSTAFAGADRAGRFSVVPVGN